MGAPDTASELAAEVSAAAQREEVTVGTAESLTGGRISCLLAAAPSASQWYRGGIVAYSREVKYGLLGVPVGPVVSQDSARAMATGAARLLGADLLVAVTGSGGPDPQDGHDPGTVWFGLFDRGTVTTEPQHFSGGPEAVVARTTVRALEMLAQCLR
ncbi:CinA family protein [Rhodococcus sp. D2-41]|uniref:CinA family protein n=1 Tax=Speluncibacter jeojiensis TaxID=2710754 RepID=UPI002410062E|nr:CinA family protein [Rhodococcus sp. D2-41]MDG3010775.1 CinA family protein [Rhodococcus sp. D2-41]